VRAIKDYQDKRRHEPRRRVDRSGRDLSA